MDEREQLVSVQLDMLRKIDQICRDNRLKYYVFFGTLLGTVRHSGYIPWDNDIDIVLMRDDYERFCEIAQKELEAPYFLSTPKNDPEIILNGKIMLKRSDTTFVASGRDVLKKGNQGIFIDILPIDKIPHEKNKQEWLYKKIDKYLTLLFLKSHFPTVKQLKKINLNEKKCRLINIPAKLLSYRYLNNRLNRFMTLFRNQNENFSYECFCNELGDYRHLMFEKEWFAETEEMNFEDIKVQVPSGYHQVLMTLYGNEYMQLPPEEKRKNRHSKICNPFVPYDIYLKHFTDIFKNISGKNVIIFGAGKMTEYFLAHEKVKPSFLIDNDANKWGNKIGDYIIKSPDVLNDIDKSNLHLIICSVYYREIEKQLIDMGITDYYFYIQNKNWL